MIKKLFLPVPLAIYCTCIIAIASLVGGASYGVFSPGGALSGTWNSQNVLLGSGAFVQGNLPVANLNSGTNASATTYWTGNGTWSAIFSTGTMSSLAFTGFSVDPSITGTYTASNSIACFKLTGLGSGTSNATSFTITGLPTAIRPTATQYGVATITNNGLRVFGAWAIDSSGVMTLANGTDISNPNFTASGAKGIAVGISGCYQLSV